MSDSPLKVALYTGSYVARDAISDSLRHKVETFDALDETATDITIFTHSSDIVDPRIRSCATVRDVLVREEFWEADLHVFEFGVYYELFDAAFMVPEDRATMAVYHNITPLDLIEDDAVRQAIERSLQQKSNLELMDHVACVSEYNRDDLLEFGISPERMSVLHLPSPTGSERVTPRPEPRTHETVNLVYVGRFVRSKGVLDLLASLRMLVSAGVSNFHITMIGSLRFSDPAVVDELRKALDSPELGPHISLTPDASDEELHAALTHADGLVIPSYHEGYCVPVLEAYVADCHVIGYRSSNLPFITGGLATLVETGNIEELTAAIRSFVTDRSAAGSGEVATDCGALTEAEWSTRVDRHLEDYTLDRYREKFLGMVGDLTG